jgi:hypothetical protein
MSGANRGVAPPPPVLGDPIRPSRRPGPLTGQSPSLETNTCRIWSQHTPTDWFPLPHTLSLLFASVAPLTLIGRQSGPARPAWKRAGVGSLQIDQVGHVPQGPRVGCGRQVPSVEVSLTHLLA